MADLLKPSPVKGMKVDWLDQRKCTEERAEWIQKRLIKVFGHGPFEVVAINGGEKKRTKISPWTVMLSRKGELVRHPYYAWFSERTPENFIGKPAEFNWEYLEPIEQY